MKRIFIILIVGLFVVFSISFVYAEKVIMNDGTEYNGNIHHQDDNVVFIVQKEDLIKLNKSDIKEIKEDEIVKKKENSLVNDDNIEIKNSDELILQIGYDFFGSYIHKCNYKEEDSTKGITFGAKYYHYFIDEFGVGLGANLQNSRDFKDFPGRIYFIPTYISLKLRSVPTEPYKYGYIVGNLGYNFFFPNSDYTSYVENEKGGIYYSIGLGIVYNHILVEITGAIHNGNAKIRSTNYDIDIEYKTYTISIGYVF